ncbi:MAG: DUF1684 domain-containing protein, partial [Candidatus Aminicenantales bacterium]
MKRVRLLIWVLLFLTSGLMSQVQAHGLGAKQEDFIQQEMTWRKRRDQQMRSPTSWLMIAGLFWLEEGENPFGSAASNTIHLPAGRAPAYAGTFLLDNGKVSVIARPGVSLKVNGENASTMRLKADDSGDPDIVALGSLEMWVIKRGGRYAIRLRDPDNPPYKKYTGLEYFPPSDEYRIVGRFIPHPQPRKMLVETVIGVETEMVSPGYIAFTMEGREYRLVAFEAGKRRLFIVFRDKTSGVETYEASRFMYSSLREDGSVDLNFNRAF